MKKLNSSILLAGSLLIISPSSKSSTAYNFINIGTSVQNHSYAFGINNSGQVVGFNGYDGGGGGYGFVYNNGTYTTLPLNIGMTVNPNDINNNGQITGYLNSSQGGPRPGFVYSEDAYYAYSTFEVPDAYTYATGINDRGDIVGWSLDFNVHGRRTGFLYSAGNFKILEGLNGIGLQFNGINNNGEIVGNAAGNYDYGEGFVYSYGLYTPIAAPFPVTWLHANGINDKGQIVGDYLTGAVESFPHVHGFIYDGTTFTSIDFPDAWQTFILGINDFGQIVGYYSDNSHLAHGFLANPSIVPIPSAFWLFGSAIGGLASFRKWRQAK